MIEDSKPLTIFSTPQGHYEIDKEYLRNEPKSTKHAEKNKLFFSILTT